MCIYLKTSPKLTYKSQEHVFPAGIGGTSKLPKGYVSDQANAYFSKLEAAFMRGSLVSLVRRFEKIGHRGKSKLKDPVICLIDKCSPRGKLSLGYIFQGDFINIPSFSILNNQAELCIPDCENKNTVFNAIKQDFLQLNANSKYCFVDGKNCDLPDNQVLVGVFNKKFFIASKDKTNIDLQKLSTNIKEAFDKFDLDKRQEETIYGRFNFSLEENEDTARCYAKIGFNILSYIQGEQYVLMPAFDNFRDWIIGKKNKSVKYRIIPESIEVFNQFPFIPPKSHKCFISNINNNLVMFVSLFGIFTYCFDLGSLPTEQLLPESIIFICDWEAKKEGQIYEFMQA